MPDVTADGPIALNLEALRTLIANVPYFQTWTGAANATEALRRVIIGSMGYNVYSVARSSNVITVVTDAPHNLSAGQLVTLEDVIADDTRFDGKKTVVSVPSTTSFTYASNGDDFTAVKVETGIVLQTQRPFVVLVPTPAQELQSRSIASGVQIHMGKIDMYMDAEVSSSYQDDPRNALVEMATAAGKLLKGMMDLSGEADYMVINEIEPVTPESFIRRTEQGNNQVRFETWQACKRIAWGLAG